MLSMLYFFSGSDREKVRSALHKSLGKQLAVRITDAHTVDDLRAALQGGGMFAKSQTVILDGTLANAEMRDVVIESLPHLKQSGDAFYIVEEKLDLDTRRRIEKYAEKSEKYDAVAKKKSSTIFAMANALAKRDKRALWVNYQSEIAQGAAPEAIHGVLFWGAKDLCMKSRDRGTQARAQKLVAILAELPHEARRRGEDLEYALERFVLSGL